MRFIIFIFISAKLFSQDTIVFRNKEVKAVKVFEVGVKEVKYHSFDNLEGPMYITEKSEIQYLKYPNGKIDTFKLLAPKVQAPVVNNGPAYPVERIEIRGKKLIYEERSLNDTKMIGLILEYPFPNTKSIMMKELSKVSAYKANRRFGLGMLGAGITCQLIGMGSRRGGGLFLFGAAAGITGTIVANVNKNKKNSKKAEIARLYNEWK